LRTPADEQQAIDWLTRPDVIPKGKPAKRKEMPQPPEELSPELAWL